MANGGITKEIGETMLREKKADLICFGVPFISNPDLVERFRDNLPLTPPDKDGFYTGGAKGYIDYPFAQKKAA
jgi:N-ethylmaleimide reductase